MAHYGAVVGSEPELEAAPHASRQERMAARLRMGKDAKTRMFRQSILVLSSAGIALALVGGVAMNVGVSGDESDVIGDADLKGDHNLARPWTAAFGMLAWFAGLLLGFMVRNNVGELPS